MATGIVKSFDMDKGFGFISNEEGTEIFVHYTGMKGGEGTNLAVGSKVEFKVVEGGPKGPEARDVRVIS